MKRYVRATTLRGAFAVASFLLVLCSGNPPLGSTGQKFSPPEGSGAARPVAGEGGSSLLEEVFELSGLKKQIAQIPDILTAQLQQQQGQVDAELYGILSRIMIEAFGAEALYETFVEHYASMADEARLLKVRDWLKIHAFERFFRSDNLDDVASSRRVTRELELRQGFNVNRELGNGIRVETSGEYVRKTRVDSYWELRSSLRKDF